MEFFNKFKLKYIHPVFVLLLFTVLIFLLQIHIRTVLQLSAVEYPLAREIVEGLIISLINAVVLYVFIFRPGWMPLNERKQAEETLLKAYGDLEKRVEERTQDLARLNTDLQNEVRDRKLAEQKLGQKSQLQEVLNSMLSISMEPHSLTELLDKILEQIVTVSWLSLGARAAIYLVSDTEPDVLIMKASVEFPQSLKMICQRVPFGKCICGLAAQTGMVQYMSCVDGRHSVNYVGMEPHGHYCVPIRQSSAKVLGVICLYLKEDYVQKSEDQNFIVSIANVLAGIIERKGAEVEVYNYRQKLEYLVEERTQEIVKINEQLKNDILKRKHVEEKLQKSLDKLRSAMGGTVSAMALTVEMRDPYTAGHQKRVSNLARAIATEMGLSEHEIDGIRMAGYLHDLGKISIPAEILSKPGKLTTLEFSMVKNHAQLGYEILKEIEFPWPVAQIVLQHHERINGEGYPSGLINNEILTEAKILAVADVVEAIASHRPYRPALGMDSALEEISKNRGILYDPAAVDICTKLIMEGFIL